MGAGGHSRANGDHDRSRSARPDGQRRRGAIPATQRSHGPNASCLPPTAGRCCSPSRVRISILTELQSDITLRDLGMHRFKGFPQPERLWQVLVPGLRHDFPPLPTDAAIPNNLPNQVTSFVGRELEISELTQLLPSSNLITIAGAGGTGKSRLSMELAAAALDSFHDGAWLVELAPITDPTFVPMAVARVLGLREEQGLSDQQDNSRSPSRQADASHA